VESATVFGSRTSPRFLVRLSFEWLEKSIAARELNLVHKIRDDPMLAPLRSDSRYPQLLRKMNLSP